MLVLQRYFVGAGENKNGEKYIHIYILTKTKQVKKRLAFFLKKNKIV